MLMFMHIIIMTIIFIFLSSLTIYELTKFYNNIIEIKSRIKIMNIIEETFHKTLIASSIVLIILLFIYSLYI